MTNPPSPLPAAIPVTNLNILLWRAVPAGMMANQTRVPDRAWRLNKNDAGELSISRQDAISAQRAHAQRTQMLANAPFPRPAPIGMLQVSVDDVVTLPVSLNGTFLNPGLTVWDDSQLPNVPQGHGYIDHAPLAGNPALEKAVASALMARARRRGWAYSIAGAPPTP